MTVCTVHKMIHRFSQSQSKVDDRVAGQAQPSFRSDIEQRHSPLQQHDPESRDIAFANAIAQEVVNLSGALVQVYPRTENESFDTVWQEDRQPSYGASRDLKGYFAPQPIETQLTQWGVDSPNQTTIVFCRSEVYKLFGDRMIREGDIIKLPYNSAVRKLSKYRVLNSFDSGNFKYGWLYHSCLVENITDDANLDIDHK